MKSHLAHNIWSAGAHFGESVVISKRYDTERTNLKSHHTGLKTPKRLRHLVSNNSWRESCSVCWSSCFRVFTSSTTGLGAKRTLGAVILVDAKELAKVRSILRTPKPTRLDMASAKVGGSEEECNHVSCTNLNQTCPAASIAVEARKTMALDAPAKSLLNNPY